MTPNSAKVALREAIGLTEPIPEGIYSLIVYASGEHKPLGLQAVRRYAVWDGDKPVSEEVFQKFLGVMRDARRKA